jgi:hypothetical protein
MSNVIPQYFLRVSPAIELAFQSEPISKGEGEVMKTKYRGRLLGGLAVVSLQFLVAGTASAHHPEISAVAVCDENNALVIEYTATAWLPVSGNIIAKRTNPTSRSWSTALK